MHLSHGDYFSLVGTSRLRSLGTFWTLSHGGGGDPGGLTFIVTKTGWPSSRRCMISLTGQG